jgi:hypothetical protein
VSEIEAKTKIRAKYLRALENEEWDLLPGPTFVKSFLRTYATALGLDGKALVEEYRLHFERPSEPPEPIVAPSRRVRVPRGMPRAPSRTGAPAGGALGPPSRGYIALVALVGVVIVLLIVGLLSSGGGGKGSSQTTGAARTHTHTGHAGTTATTRPHHAGSHAGETVSVALRATGTVYVCLIGEGSHKLVAGQTLEEGQRTPTFHARHFELTLGNNAVVLTIDGTPRSIPASSEAIGYSITKAGRRPLAPGHLPTCE